METIGRLYHDSAFALTNRIVTELAEALLILSFNLFHQALLFFQSLLIYHIHVEAGAGLVLQGWYGDGDRRLNNDWKII